VLCLVPLEFHRRSYAYSVVLAIASRAARVNAIGSARQPIIFSGSGVLWSHAWDEMKAFVEKAGVPFYTTPQGRGIVPDDHPYSKLMMRQQAAKRARRPG
jgi:thiamine pyrophosphate-dependent acetolactate synthase large subunit-like protein